MTMATPYLQHSRVKFPKSLCYLESYLRCILLSYSELFKKIHSELTKKSSMEQLKDEINEDISSFYIKKKHTKIVYVHIQNQIVTLVEI